LCVLVHGKTTECVCVCVMFLSREHVMFEARASHMRCSPFFRGGGGVLPEKTVFEARASHMRLEEEVQWAKLKHATGTELKY
jgi:hypothetical protein